MLSSLKENEKPILLSMLRIIHDLSVTPPFPLWKWLFLLMANVRFWFLNICFTKKDAIMSQIKFTILPLKTQIQYNRIITLQQVFQS